MNIKGLKQGLFFVAGVLFTALYFQAVKPNPMDSLVTVGWGDGKYGKAFYGAKVYFEKQDEDRYSVKARIYVSRKSNYYHDCGEIGLVASPEEAVAKFSQLEWSLEGLTIGNGSEAYFISRKTFENHR